MRTRPVLALALAASMALAGGAASAAPKKPKPKVEPPACNLVIDEKGDDGNEVHKHSDSLDLTGADIASSAKTVTAVLRVAKFSKSNDAFPTGRAWYLDFSIPGAETPLWLGATITPTGESFNYGWVDGTIHRTLGQVAGVFDEAKNEIRISADSGIWAERGAVKPGSKISGLTALSYNYVGASAAGRAAGSLQPGDEATGSKTYTAGAPSCVEVGK